MMIKTLTAAIVIEMLTSQATSLIYFDDAHSYVQNIGVDFQV